MGGAGRAPFSAALWVWKAPGDHREQYGYLTDGQNVPERESLRLPAETGPPTPGPLGPSRLGRSGRGKAPGSHPRSPAAAEPEVDKLGRKSEGS